MIPLFNEESIQKAYGKEKYDEGVAVGEARGKDEQARTTVLNLHAAGMDNCLISKMVGYAESVVTAWIATAHA